MKIRGFTVVELMMTIAILAILLSIGIPSFSSIVGNSNMSANSSDLLTAFNYARTEAIKRGASVALGKNDGSTWSGGLVVWVDENGDGSLGNTEEVLRYWDAFSTDSSLVSSNSVTSFIFRATGEVNNADTLTLCDSRTGETGRTISVLLSGAIYAENYICT